MKRNPIIRILTDPTRSFLANFVLGTLVFTIASDGISDLFWGWIETRAAAQLWVTKELFQNGVRVALVLVLLLFIYGTDFAQYVKQWMVNWGILSEPAIANVTPLKNTYSGLIVMMSKKDNSPAEVAIRHHLKNNRLKFCWIICTRDSMPYAQRMLDKLKTDGVMGVRFYYGSDPIEDVEKEASSLSLLVPDACVDDPNYIRRLVEGIYAEAAGHGLQESDIMADYTGCPKGMTAGMLLACVKPERSLQYISQIHWPQIMEVNIAYKLKQKRSANK